MRGGTVQITWHDAKPVLTLDFHSPTGLLATGGADFDIKLWLIAQGEALMKVPTACYHSNLSYHGSAVNILRFSPSGDLLASGADGGELILWKMHSVDDAHTWKVLKTLLFHRKDVLDLQWSSDGAFLISGSVDNSCIIWDINKGSVHQILDAHLHYVQGVAWDPLGQYVASLSSDRTCRIYMNKPAKVKGSEKLNYVCQHVVTKAEQQNQDDSKPSLTKHHLFHDETLPSFFRRFSWSPDGSFLLAPAGIYKVSADSTIINTAYIFSRKDLSRPALQLPGASKPIVAVRFCPVVFSLRGSDSAAFFKLPYRIIFAVATLNSLYIYDTESVPPIAILAGVHYSAITDIAWSSDAKFLALSSQDGYCTILEFENGELGTPSSLSVGRKIPEENTDSMPQELENTKSVAVESTEIDNLLKSETDTKIIEEKPTLLSSEDTKEAIKPVRKRISPIAVENTKSVAVENMEINNLPKIKTDKKIIEKPTSLLSSADTKEATKPARKRITPIAVEKP